jgi:hypothetical protein
MSEDLETIKEEPIETPKKKGRPFKAIENEEPFVAKPRGRPFKTITNEEPFVPKPRGRPRTTESKIPRKTKEELRAYYREYYEEHKDEIMLKRADYRKTENYKQLRHEQNARYKAKVALRPKVCLIDIKSLEPQKGVCLIKI